MKTGQTIESMKPLGKLNRQQSQTILVPKGVVTKTSWDGKHVLKGPNGQRKG